MLDPTLRRRELLQATLAMGMGWRLADAGRSDENRVNDIGSRRELFVDRGLIDRMTGTELRLQTPIPREVAIRYDLPWEDEFAFYSTLLKDGDTFRLYYRGRYTKPVTTCYAESTDGIHWTKPELGLVEFRGSKKNNVILPTALQFCPFIDSRPGVPETERYKANSRDPRDSGGLVGYVSADAIHWRQIDEKPIVPSQFANNFDSQNVMFWSQAEQCYVLYARHMADGRRATARATSKDFLHWSGQTLMSYSDTGTTIPSAQLYTNQTRPYFRAPHIYVSMPGRIFFADQRHVPRQDDKLAAQQRLAAVTPRVREFFEKNVNTGGGGVGDVSDAVFLTSRAGSTRYDFTFKESFVRPGIGLGHWTTRTNYPASGVVQTSPSEMSFYMQRHYAQKTANLQRMSLRLDGFVALHAPHAGGEMRTQPLTFSGCRLEINYSTSAAGSLRIEMQDVSGKPLPEHSLADCPEIFGDDIERVVEWKSGSDVSQFAGQPIRLRFVMKDADLFSIRFAEGARKKSVEGAKGY